ncbi:MAG TPA: PEP-CTERM sorting domain-containing protein, partial [Gammaproteobacteria bacterium]|nr:PEP-CTERM sorting domain-containing protein [Gammaproteobacteria bacterium]
DGDVTFNSGFVDVILGFTPAPEDLLEFLVIQGTLNVSGDFGGIRGIAAAGSNVALGTEFTVLLGGQQFQGIVTSAVPLPPSMLLFGAGLIGLVAVARRKAA